ncbi:MAG: polysaccharide pyruvyl transferase family protein [Armatimonadetes bacterium]|nr:polysaccharide pyruvyl transferase family protein [Armatimonadota bacterium]
MRWLAEVTKREYHNYGVPWINTAQHAEEYRVVESIGKRIVITGAFCSLNRGDAAMRIALIDALRVAVKDCHITVMTPHPELDSNAYSSDLTIRCSRRKPLKAMLNILRALCWRAVKDLFGKNVALLLNDELQVYRHSDLVVDLGGDGLTEEYGIKCLISHLVPIVLGKVLGRPVFVCAQTIGPYNKTRSLCRYVLRKADRISAREGLTLNYLKNLGLNGSRVSLTADMAFLMRPAPARRAREILSAEGVPADKPLIGCSVSHLPGHIYGSFNLDRPTKYEIEIAGALDRVVEMGIRPVFISHATGPGRQRDDRLVASRVVKRMRHDSEAIILAGDYCARETKALIGEMEMFLGVRMHSCIAALSQCVPTIAVAYGPKAVGMMELAGQSHWMMHITQVTAEGLFGLIREAWESRHLIRTSLQAKMPEVFALAERNVEIIKEMLDVSGTTCGDASA